MVCRSEASDFLRLGEDRRCGDEQGRSQRKAQRETADCGGNAAGGSKVTGDEKLLTGGH